MFFPVVLGIAAFLAFMHYKNANQAPGRPGQFDPAGAAPTPGVWSVIVTGPDGSMQARRDFPEDDSGWGDGGGENGALAWVRSRFGGASIRGGSLYAVYGPDGQVAMNGSADAAGN